MRVLKVVLCGSLGAVVGAGIATSLQMRDADGWAAIPLAMLAGGVAGGIVGVVVGVVAFT